jgi:hypothetical protein
MYNTKSLNFKVLTRFNLSGPVKTGCPKVKLAMEPDLPEIKGQNDVHE